MNGERGGGGTITNPRYSRHHPKWYRRRMPIFWWLRKFSYTQFITRELTSLLVGYAALLILAHVWFLARGPEEYAAFAEWLRRPWVVAVNTFAVLGLVYHAITWLKLAPQALVLHMGERRIPDGVVAGAHYAAWLVVSALVFWLVVGRGP